MRADDLDHEGLLELDADGGAMRFAGQRALLLDAVANGTAGKEIRRPRGGLHGEGPMGCHLLGAHARRAGRRTRGSREVKPYRRFGFPGTKEFSLGDYLVAAILNV